MENNKNSQIFSNLKQFFDKEDYVSAIKLIKNNQVNFDPGVYEFNLGVANYKNNNLVGARVWFEKAKLKGFLSNELNQALSEVTSKLELSRLEESQNFTDSFNQISIGLPVDVYYTVSLIFFVILAVFYKKLDKYIRFIVLALGLMPLAFYQFHVKNYRSIIVLEDEVVYRGPSLMFEQIQLIPKGMKLITGKTHNGWRYILTPSSHRGWFYTGKVENL